MADNYLEFSEVIPRLSNPEADWLRQQLQIVHVFGDKEYAEDELPDHLKGENAEWVGCRAYRDMADYDPADGDGAGFEYEFHEDHEPKGWGRHLWLYAVEYAELDRLAHLIRKFLKAFRPNDVWSLTYATFCSKPRVGEFSGGALFVTAADVKWNNAYDFVEEQVKVFHEQSAVPRLVQLVEESNLADDALDETVHETAASRASSINNGGPAEQIEYVVGQLGAKETERTLRTLIAFCKAQKEEPDENTPDS
jgi:hypothetical protein